jgi:hypothetical protein
MEGKMDASADAEGQFGRPEFFSRFLPSLSRHPSLPRNGVSGRMDTKFPHHPLMPSEAGYRKNVEAAELDMLRKTMGSAMPLKLAMERKVNQ